MPRHKKFLPILDIVWSDILERSKRMEVRATWSEEDGVTFHIAGRIFSQLTMRSAATTLLAFEAAFAAAGFECYACMRIALDLKVIGGHSLCPNHYDSGSRYYRRNIQFKDDATVLNVQFCKWDDYIEGDAEDEATFFYGLAEKDAIIGYDNGDWVITQ